MKRNMVYGILGIKVRNAMWNAGMNGYSKENSCGELICSPQSIGYAIKEQLERDGFNILYRKVSNDKGDLTLKEAFELKTGTNDKKTKTPKDMQKVLFGFEDIVQFGTTFTAYTGALSFGITGAVQFGVGVNKYKYTNQYINDVLSCFKSDKKEDKKETTKSALGKQILIDKALFLQDFTTNPFQYEKYIGVVDGFEGYTEENHQNIKKASIKCVSNSNTKSKKGCTNDFALFVETKDEIRDSINLNCLSEYVEVDMEEDGTTVYYLEALADLLNEVKNDLKSVEIYYNHRTSRLIGEIENAKYFNIVTRKELV